MEKELESMSLSLSQEGIALSVQSLRRSLFLASASRSQLFIWGTCVPERVWVISIARLRTLPPLHLRPIYVIVFNDPYMEILS